MLLIESDSRSFGSIRIHRDTSEGLRQAFWDPASQGMIHTMIVQPQLQAQRRERSQRTLFQMGTDAFLLTK